MEASEQFAAFGWVVKDQEHAAVSGVGAWRGGKCPLGPVRPPTYWSSTARR